MEAVVVKKSLKRKIKIDIGPPPKPKRVRRYKPEYLQFGFVNGGSEFEPKGQCVECSTVLANQSLNPSKLKRHLGRKHPELVGMPLEYFERKVKGEVEEGPPVSGTPPPPPPPPPPIGTSKKALKASYLVSRFMAQNRKPFTMAQEFILPAAVDMCREMIGEDAAKQLLSVPLSSKTVSLRITDMAVDIQSQLLERLKSSPFFSLQLDESTDVSGALLLLVFVRYHWEKSLHEDMLFCRELPGEATAEQCFQCIDDYFTENELDWQKCMGVCSDGVAPLTGRHDEVINQILERAPEAKWTHCFLHLEGLADKKMSPEFHEVKDVCVKAINFLKKNYATSRCFGKLCQEMEADHVQLLQHSDVGWLSRGPALGRLFELRSEIGSFLREKNSPLAHYYTDTKFIVRLAYLCDIFSLLSQLNASFQGKNSNIISVADKVEAFKKKLAVWTHKAREKKVDMFPLLCEILENSPQREIYNLVALHLSQLSQKFQEFYPEDPSAGHTWILDPFSVELADSDLFLTPHQESELLDVSTDSVLKLQWGKLDLGSFWIFVSKEYTSLAQRALKQLLPFSSTALCESGLSIVAATKTKTRNRLGPILESTLRVSLSPIPPRVDLIVSQKQAQVSH